MDILGERIKKLRQEKKITQEALGRICGVTKYTISLYESGKSTPNDQIKGMLADYFDVSVDYLLGRTDERNFDKFKPSYKHNKEDIEKIKILTKKDEKEIEKMLTQMRESLTKQDGLMLSGEPASEEALESILDALEYGMRQAKRINKKYTPKKYRKEDTD